MTSYTYTKGYGKDSCGPYERDVKEAAVKMLREGLRMTEISKVLWKDYRNARPSVDTVRRWRLEADLADARDIMSTCPSCSQSSSKAR